jgi:hypothetical protein
MFKPLVLVNAASKPTAGCGVVGCVLPFCVAYCRLPLVFNPPPRAEADATNSRITTALPNASIPTAVFT